MINIFDEIYKYCWSSKGSRTLVIYAYYSYQETVCDLSSFYSDLNKRTNPRQKLHRYSDLKFQRSNNFQNPLFWSEFPNKKVEVILTEIKKKHFMI